MARTFREYLRPPRKLRFTRDGRWFVGMTIMVGVGAINTGNNLLYLMLGMMLGLIIVSGILSERVLRKVDVRRLPAGDLFAGRTSRLNFEVTNGKRWLSSFSIAVAEHESRETRAQRRRAIGLPALRPRRRKDREAEHDPGGPSALAMRVPPGRAAIATAEYVFPRRGLYRYAGLDLGTRFPFGFFEKIRPIREPAELLVYPEIRLDEAARTREDQVIGEVERAAEGRSGDFFGLREFRHGDDRRDVHWKVSARRNQLVRRLYERQDNEAVAVHLYNWAPGDTDDAPELAVVEESIVQVASLCAALARDGRRFSLHTIDEHVPEGAGAGQLQTVLRQLALLQIRRDAEAPPIPLASGQQKVLVAPRHAPPEIAAPFHQVVPVSARRAA